MKLSYTQKLYNSVKKLHKHTRKRLKRGYLFIDKKTGKTYYKK